MINFQHQNGVGQDVDAIIASKVTENPEAQMENLTGKQINKRLYRQQGFNFEGRKGRGINYEGCKGHHGKKL